MKTLQKLIYKNMLVSSLIPIFVIELALLLLYFVINFHTSAESQRLLLEQEISNLQAYSEKQAASINHKLLYVAQQSTMMQRNQQRFFKELALCKREAHSPKYVTHSNGAFYKKIDDGGSSLYYSAAVKIDSIARRKAVCSDVLDATLKDVVETNPLINQAYLDTWDSMERIYPFVQNIAESYGSDANFSNQIYYFLADKKHNPERKTVWTNAYMDQLGHGLMVSCLTPIYNGDFLEGVGAIDVTIDTLLKEVLNLHLPWDATAFLMGANGDVLAMPQQAQKLLGLAAPDNEMEVAMIKTHNLFSKEHEKLATLLKHIISDSKHEGEASFAGKDYFIRIDTIEQTGWKLVVLVDKTKMLAPVKHLRDQAITIGWLAGALMLGFYSIFFLYLKRKSKSMSLLIASPIERLSMITKDISNKLKPSQIDPTGILEIDQLSSNFSQMNEELETSTNALVQEQVKQKIIKLEREMLLQLVSTDQLTGLANRRKLDDTIKEEIEHESRHTRSFGVIIIDVDHFKLINDNHGHDIGDLVLQEIAQILTDNIRETDLVGRWGGEEFLVLVQNTTSDDLCQIAEFLRLTIEKHKFPHDEKVTVSLGLTQLRAGDNASTLVVRADKALYQAKHDGRNRWVFS
jgi:diguanylate cyclase (GGDEF)-like protein